METDKREGRTVDLTAYHRSTTLPFQTFLARHQGRPSYDSSLRLSQTFQVVGISHVDLDPNAETDAIVEHILAFFRGKKFKVHLRVNQC